MLFRVELTAMDMWLGIFEDEQPLMSLAHVDHGVTRLWVDGHARDFAALSQLEVLETLSIYRLPRRHVPVLMACDLPRLAALCVRHADAEDLSFLAALGSLETLTIWQSPKLKRLDGLEGLARLTTLTLMDVGNIESLEPLATLTELRSLALTGGVCRTQGLPSLVPLAALTKLEELDVEGSRVANCDVSPLCYLTQLNHLSLSPRLFEPRELAGVAAAHPSLRRELLDLVDFDRLAGTAGCKVCGSHRKALFLRGKKLLWCPRCEGVKLAAILDDFERMVEEELQKRVERRTLEDHAW